MHLLIQAMNLKIKADNCTLQTSQRWFIPETQNHLGWKRLLKRFTGKKIGNTKQFKHSEASIQVVIVG